MKQLRGGLILVTFLFGWLVPGQSAQASGADDFIFTVQTNRWTFTKTFTIPTAAGSTYNYDVDCDNDGTFEATGQTGDYTCSYPSVGTYEIRIQGTFPRIDFGKWGYPYNEAKPLITVNQWGTGAWASMSEAFRGCANFATIAATDTPNLSGVTDMSRMFSEAINFDGDISGWNVSHVTNMEGTFASASSFNQNISGWNVSNVTNMISMFDGAEVFNRNIGGWDVSKVTTMQSMFVNTTTFNQNIGSWNVSNVTDMSDMFHFAHAFNQNIGSWNVSNVTDMSWMFTEALSFNQDISSWNVSNVIGMGLMFSDAAAFNKNISGWNVSKVTQMSVMFGGATAFDQDLSSWDVSHVTDMHLMFNRTALSSARYNNMLAAWSLETVQSNVVFGAESTQYCGASAAAARAILTGTHNWTINDAGACQAATPIAAPAGGSYVSIQNVALSTTTPGASIYYTTNGTTPTASSIPYSSPITVSSTQTIKAIAIGSSGYSNSGIMSEYYIVVLPDTNISASPVGGTFDAPQTVTLSTMTSGATIYFSTNGYTPSQDESNRYIGPITVSTTTYIRAIAVKAGYNTTLIDQGYIINIPVAATPTATPTAGTYASAQSVTLSTTTSGAIIYYTTDGSTPTTSSTQYTGAITFSSTQTIKAIATATGYTNSAIMTQAYTINTSSGPSTTPVYRFYNTKTGEHFFTIDPNERANINAHPQWNYNDEGIAFYVYQNQQTNTTPVYRFYNTRSGFHFFTIDPNERATINAHPEWNYTDEGTAFYVYPSQQSGSTSIFRFYNTVTGEHFFTIDPNERATINAHPEWGYHDEGVAFSVMGK